MSEKEGGEQDSFQIISPVFHLSVNKTCILYKNNVLLCKRRGKDAGDALLPARCGILLENSVPGAGKEYSE